MKAAAIDIGLKRIGIAISPDGKIVLPLKAVLRKNRKQAAADVSRILKEYEIDILIVGVPVGGSSEEEMRKRAHHFASLLDFDGKVYYQDESFSSKEALERTRGIIKQKRDGRIDSLAAQIILERWLEENRK
ncbi:Holliday junction resolvase RuvX [Nitrosophilus alvini]|uniref:Holliday junction resolvase RuvX n=1 Tax=Nitrosophilus alvini TaxID=2714855 RepID=UPI001F33F29E|nr:Holliday junction resolvase RuvX [Nitrosophilus alvini]